MSWLRYPLLLAMAGLIAAIGWFDIITGSDYGMSLFYLAPVVITAWYVSTPWGVLLGIGAGVLWFVSELVGNGVPMLATTWNGVTRAVIFVSAALLLGMLRADRRRLRRLLAIAESTSRTDPLTGLANSRAFYERLRLELERVKRYGHPITLAYIDVDNFKLINDRFGHAKGDEVLKQIAAALRTCVRTSDICARLGGDEFAIVLLESSLTRHAFEQRLTQALDPVTSQYLGTGLGTSVGFAELRADADIDATLRAADEAMYAAKVARKAESIPRLRAVP